VKADYTISTLKDLADTINTIQNVKIIQWVLLCGHRRNWGIRKFRNYTHVRWNKW
jgi:hypothetical protein